MNPQAIEQIPGQLNNRKTIMGELNWIFTAITDTIAWNILSSFSLLSSLFSLLPPDLFQRLFRLLRQYSYFCTSKASKLRT